MKVIHHVVDVGVPREKVWSAITDEVGLAGWWSTQTKAPPASVGSRIEFTFAGDFNPVMEITKAEPGVELNWRCVGGHDRWNDNTFRFLLAALDDGRTRLRFWQDYATELSDDAYGIYNFNWGYYLDSLLQLCATGTGKPFDPEEAR
jgi:uncharacterized protein YndB with AHSA1/START domain